MTFTLVRKLLRDIRVSLAVVCLILFLFAALWVKVTQRVSAEISPFFNALSKMAKVPPKLMEDVLFELPDLPIIFVNESGAKLIGYRPEELIGKPAMSMADPEQIERLMRMAEARLRGEDLPLHFESVAVKKDGSRLPIEISLSFVEVGGRLVNVNFVADLSARIEAQAALVRSDKQFKRVIESAPVSGWGARFRPTVGAA